MSARLDSTVLVAVAALGWILASCETADRGASTTTSPPPASPASDDMAAAPNEEPTRTPPDTSGLERDVARPGSDYREIAMDTADPILCKQYCDKQMRCMAFTYVRPDDRHGPRCRLKQSIPQKVEGEACCVSGVNPRAKRRIAQLEAQGLELDADRPGSNFRSFEMPLAEPTKCKDACENLRDCQAFTYVRPGYKGENAYCYLKKDVPEKVANKDCCISGVKKAR